MTAVDVSFVCQWYHPEPVSQPGWIVAALQGQGFRVVVLTGVPNYPSGRTASGYRAWRPSRERVDGVEVRRAPLYPSHDSSVAKRFLNYGSWAVSSAVFGLSTLRRSRVSLVYSSPATAALPAMLARWLFGVQYVLLVQDVWPDSIFASGFLVGRKRRYVERLLRLFVSAAYRNAHHIAVISPGMEGLLAHQGVPRSRISVVYNWVDVTNESASAGAADLRERLGIGETHFVVMYAGNHGPAQALHTAIDAFAGIPSEVKAHLVMIGDGIAKPDLVRRTQELGGGRIHFLDPVPRTRMSELMAQADAQLVCLARRPLFAVTTPSKLQSVLAAGHPVIVAADGDAAQVVKAARAGVAVPAEDSLALAQAVVELASSTPEARRELGFNGRAHYETVMAAEVGAARLAGLLHSAAAAHRRERRG